MKNESKKTIKHKKTKNIIITMSAVALIIFLFVGLWICFYTALPFDKSHNVEISSDTIKNIPFGRDDLVKIGDKLYYNYEPKGSFDERYVYGLYEITSSGARRVYWGGPRISDSSNLFGLDTAEDSLIGEFSEFTYDETSNGQVYKYNTFWHNFEIINELSEATPAHMRACKYVDGAYFYYLPNALYIQKEDKLEKITDAWQINDDTIPVVYRYFIESKDLVYYIKPDGEKPDEETSILCSYSIPQKKETEIRKIELRSENIAELFIDGDTMILGLEFENTLDSPLYMSSIDKNDELIKILDDHSGFGGTIVYDGMIYSIDFYSDSNGLYSIDLSNVEKRNKLYDGEVMSVHIFDSKWIYFTNDKAVLYRITHDGKTLEKVFG